MIFYVENTSGDFYRMDTACYGMLSDLHVLNSIWYSGDISKWGGEVYEELDYLGGPGPLEGLKVNQIKAIYTSVCDLFTEQILLNDMFNNITFENGSNFEPLDSNENYIRLEMSEVPCDELFVPMFMLRNIFNDPLIGQQELYEKALEIATPFQAMVLANLFYKSDCYDFSEHKTVDKWYLYQDDGSVFRNSRVGDLVQILSGKRPVFNSLVWGEVDSGYPCDGVYHVFDKKEGRHILRHDQSENLTDCMEGLEDYNDVPFKVLFLAVVAEEFSNLEEVVSFMKKVMSYVK